VSDVEAYHPGTDAYATVPEEALSHLRISGWLLLAEHQANLAEAEAREAVASSGKATSKSSEK